MISRSPLFRRSALGKPAFRSAFTLVEMLVVVSLIVIMAGIAVLFVPRASEQQAAARAGVLFQSWLSIARQRALRDRVPTGLRLIIDQDPINAGKMYVRQCVFIQRPDDFNGGKLSTTGAAPYTTIEITPDSATGAGELYGTPANVTDSQLWEVQPGDYIQVMESGQVHRIVDSGTATNDISYDFTAKKYTIKLVSPIPFAINGTTQYRVIRGARQTPEEPLELNSGVAIDLQTNTSLATTPDIGSGSKFILPISPQGYFDILFSPSGEVFGIGATMDFVPFWVRDISTENIMYGEPTIIAVHTRTGLIAAHPPNDTDANSDGFIDDPYSFVKDGRSD